MQRPRATTNAATAATRAIGCAPWDDRDVASRKKKRSREEDPLATYRRIRKPMPPPEKVIPDRRRELEDERARKEIRDDAER
jgi:hypothetical protein